MKDEKTLKAFRDDEWARWKSVSKDGSVYGGMANGIAHRISFINYLISDDPDYTLSDGIDEFRRDAKLGEDKEQTMASIMEYDFHTLTTVSMEGGRKLDHPEIEYIFLNARWCCSDFNSSYCRGMIIYDTYHNYLHLKGWDEDEGEEVKSNPLKRCPFCGAIIEGKETCSIVRQKVMRDITISSEVFLEVSRENRG